MSLRTPGLQLRSRFHAYWGDFEDPAGDLPNQANNPLPAALFALERGDVAVASGTRYTCVSPGTPGGGDAVWWASQTSLIQGVRGFEAGAAIGDRAFYARAGLGDPLAGVNDFALSVVFQADPDGDPTNNQRIISTSNQFFVGGISISYDWGTAALSVDWTDSAAGGQVIAVNLPALSRSKLIHAIARYDGGNGEMSLFAEGSFLVGGGGAAGPLTSTGLDFTVGAAADGLDTLTTAARGMQIHGASIVPTLLTEAQILAWWRAVSAAGVQVGCPGIGAVGQETWRAYDGNPGATWAPSEGANVLSIVGTAGTLAVSSQPRVWS
mgnify:CR=1 FL=1